MPRRRPTDRPKRTPEEHAELIARAVTYDVEVLGELTDEHRDVDDLVVDEGDELARIEADLIAGVHPMIWDQAAMHREMQSMRTLLDAPDPTGVARYLVDLVAFDWLMGVVAARRLVDVQRHGTNTDIAHLDRALTRAHSRFLNAQASLDHHRRARPAPLYQLNLAQQQVVIAPTNPDEAI
jgi:hypothetical protein